MQNSPLQIGTLIYDGIDQIDVTGPFEVLSRIPGAVHRLYAQADRPVKDVMGLRLMPDATMDQAPQLYILHVPGGQGQEALMDAEDVHKWLIAQSRGAKAVLSVCTGALLLGSAGLLIGKRATTHWASTHLLKDFGATFVDERVVVDDQWTFAAGVTAGIDGALRLVSEIAGQEASERIQLDIAYAPEPPFNSGDPKSAPAEIVAEARGAMADLIARREATARRIAQRLGIGRSAALADADAS